MSERWFTWLTPAAPAAIAVLRLTVADGPLARWPVPGSAAFVRLRAPDGAVVDEAVALRLDERTAELCTHGGVGVRQAVAECLRAYGWQERHADGLAASEPRWAALAAAPSPAAAAWLLAHDGPPPFRADFLRRQPVVLITGPANAGKSTLLNAWCGHRRALVSDTPGTTRDLVAGETLVAGWRLRLYDSAGLRATADPLEAAGQELVAQARAMADLVLFLQPADLPAAGAQTGDLVVHGKADLVPPPPGALAWSAFTAAGRSSADLLAAVGEAVLARLGLPLAAR